MANSDDIKNYLHNLLLVNGSFTITDLNSFIASNGNQDHMNTYNDIKNILIHYHRLKEGSYTDGANKHIDYIKQVFIKLDNHDAFVIPTINNSNSTHKISEPGTNDTLQDSYISFQPKSNIPKNQLDCINELETLHTNLLSMLKYQKDQLKSSIPIALHFQNVLIFLKVFIYIVVIDILHPTTDVIKGQHINNIKKTVDQLMFKTATNQNNYNNMSKSISSLTVNNKIINENKDRYNDTMNIITTREYIMSLQMYEFYISLVILSMIIILAMYLNNDKRTHSKIKYLIVVCILITICVYLMDNFFINGREIERFASSTEKQLYINTIIGEIKNYGNTLKKNIDTRDVVIDNINTKLDREVRKNNMIKESTTNLNANIDGIYSEMYRDTISYQETLYFIIYLIIICLMLNAYFVEIYKYFGDTDYITAWTVWTVALLLGIGVYLTKYYYRTRPNSLKYDFVKPSDE